MMFSVGPWELAIALSKMLSYLGLASLSGGIFVLWLGGSLLARRKLVNLLLLACAAGVFAVTLFYLLQVGAINQMGVAGMFDIAMIQLLAQSSVGYGAGLKLAGFVVAGLAILLSRTALLSATGRLPSLLICAWLLATALFAISFAVLGHIAELGLVPRLAVTAHIVVIGLWTGSLYPLHLLAGTESTVRLQPLLQLFGRVGWGIIVVLVASGVTLLLQVLGTASELFMTPYGLQLLLKLVLVCALLSLAALNKFRLVPALLNGREGLLRRSIAAEMTLAFLILLLTATMTTFTGPAYLM